MYYVYVLRCSDDSLYSGICVDVEKRYEQHLNKEGAKYTRSHPPVKIEAIFKCENRSQASKLEYQIKHLSKIQKEKLIICEEQFIDQNIYQRIDTL